ncbi:MAG: universal stress protein UspA [Eubacteriales bacterium]|nr:universal stress protein UspA [Eubacteriales bacterium]
MMEAYTPILVLVTLQRACARLIRHGADMALMEHRPLHVLYVSVADTQNEPMRAMDSQTLDYLYALSGEAGAEMTVLRAQVAVTSIAEFASRNNVKRIVMGGGENAAGIAETLSSLLPGVQVMIMEDVEQDA